MADGFKIGSAYVEVLVKGDRAKADATRLGVDITRRLPDRNIKVGLNAAGAIAGLGAITSAAGLAGAALAAIPGLAGSAAGIGGVLVGSFAGVGDALKGYAKDQDNAAKASTSGASAARSSARQIRDAQQSVDDARRNAARVARDSAERVQEALKDEARTARDVADDIAAARDAQAETAARGADQMADASRRVEDALDAERSAHEDLTDAIADQQAALADLREQVSDYALTEEDAAIRVERAKEKLAKTEADGKSSALDLREARNDLAQAEERLRDIQEERAKKTADLAEAERLGVAGSEKVIDAQKRVKDAEEAVQKARSEQAKTTAEAAKANTEAAKRVADAVRDGAERQADAAKAVAQAQRDSSEAQQDAARAVQDAAESLADAQASANEATSAGAAATSEYADAMKKLLPSQRTFVEQLISMKPLVDGLKKAGADAFLPGMTSMLKDSEGLFPIFEGHLQRTGDIMGETAVRMGQLFKSQEFKDNLAELLRSSEPITGAIGDTMVRMTGKVVEFGAQMAPAASGFATFIGDTTTGLEGFFDALAPRADTFKSVWESLGRITAVVLPAVGEAVGKIADVLGPTLEQVAGFLEANKDSLDEWGLSILGLFAVLKGAKVVASVADWTSGVVGKVGEMGAKIGLSGGQIGLALAGITAAAAAGIWVWDQLRSKAGEYAVAVANGSMTFQQAVDDELRRIQARQTAYEGMQGEGYATGKLIGEITGKIDSNATALQQEEEAVRSVTTALEKHLGTLSPLEVAKARVSVAEGIYNDKLREFGPLADDTKRAQERLSQAVNDEELAQQAAKLATQDHTDALKEQQDQILGAMSADLAHRQSLHDLKQAQDNAAKAARNHGEGSDEAKEAGFRLEAAELRVIETAKRLALETSGATTESQKNKVSADAQMGAMLNLAATMGKNASPSLQQYARDLRQSDLDAYNATVRTSGFAFEVKKLPDGREVLITTPGLDSARAGIQGLQRDILNINGKTVDIFVTATGKGGMASAGRLATGGIVPGYTPGRDIAPYMLSGGEAVMRPEWTRAVGPGWIDGANKAARAGGIPGAKQYMQDTGALIGFANGGIVARANYAPPATSPQALVDSYNERARQLGAQAAAAGAGIGASIGSGGSGVQRWAGMVAQALSIVGQPGSLVQTTLRRMNQESGGNPNAVNRWDSNWKRGTPSVGLMQVIGPTYRAYKAPGHDIGPYLYGTSINPLSNTLASMRYALRRYGSLSTAYNRKGGYDQGGVAHGIGMLPKHTPRPERVLSPSQTEAFERLVSVLEGMQNGPQARAQGDVHVHLEQASGSPAETGRFVALALRGVG